jgi:hypothetical protein
MAMKFPERVHLRLVQQDERGVRPITRADCDDVPRPCPWIECRYHNARVERDGRSSEPGRLRGLRIAALDDPHRSCALDVAEAGGVEIGEVAEILGLTVEGARLAEERALASLRRALEAAERDDEC